jgi:hypothetical protein
VKCEGISRLFFTLTLTTHNVLQVSAGERFCSGATDDREREGASLVSLNHPLTINPVKQENYYA